MATTSTTSPTSPRRHRRRLAGLAVVAGLVVVACGSDDDADEASDAATDTSAAPATDAAESSAAADPFAPGLLESGATIDRFEQGDLIVHTYTEPSLGNTTTIFESDNSLVLVDAHFAESTATEFRAFADSLDKPIERLFLTHEHPDHIGGVDPVFTDVTSASSAGVVEAAAAADTTIDEVVEPGEITIDGVRYVLDVFFDAEADGQLVLHLPDNGVMAIGDLIYFEYHAVMSPTFDNGLSILSDLEERDGVELVLPGHGFPAGPEAFGDMADYLTTAQGIYDESDDGETFSAAMVDAFPDRAGANLLEFGLDRLYPKAGS